MSLRGRLLMLLVALVIVVGAGGGTGAALVGARDSENNTLRDLTTARRRAEQLTTAYVDQSNALIAYFLNPTAILLGPYTAAQNTGTQLIRSLHTELANAPTLRPDLDRISATVESVRKEVITPAIALVQAHRSPEALSLLLRPDVRTQATQVRSQLNTLGRDIDRAMRQHNSVRNGLNGWLLVDSIATLVALGVCVVVAAVLIDRWTKRPIDKIAAAVRAVRAGALTTQVPAVGPPELAALGHDVDDMRARIIHELAENIRAREALEQNAALVLALRRLLEPEPTGVPAGWRVATGLRPAEGLVAGDSYDVALLPDGHLALVLIDIAGHGAVSAVSSLRCQELLGVALADGRKPGDAIAWQLEQMRDPGIELFFTAFVATLDPDSGRCCYANAGHPAPLLSTEEGVVQLAPSGPIVGPIAGPWATEETVIAPGCSLAIYTDGLTDPRHGDDENSSLRELSAMLEGPAVSPEGIVDRLLERLESRNAGRLRDDVTIVVVRRDDGHSAPGAAAFD
ncbi:MAG: SpoIIE family protein phosphatase [Actinobacteria bacterium]|nr:SpoIIE family protein phosphatase [Actinomycetota bacterium]